jgi:hypothetical protein
MAHKKQHTGPVLSGNQRRKGLGARPVEEETPEKGEAGIGSGGSTAAVHRTAQS